jgi:phosphosulfolactate synthase (CoM biosynthesis protein A)
MTKLQKDELRVKRSFAIYVGGLEFKQLESLENAKEMLQTAKEMGYDKNTIEDWKLQIKCIQYRLNWIEDLKLSI